MTDHFTISDVRESEVEPNVVDVTVTGVVGGHEVSGSVSYALSGLGRATANLGHFPGYLSRDVEEAVHTARFHDRSFDVQAFFDALASAVAAAIQPA